MQTKALFLASGIHKFCPDDETALCRTWEKKTMSKTASLGFAPSNTLFGRLMATIDRWLMASARISARNGDLPYFGL
jgi:hypothetical protein